MIRLKGKKKLKKANRGKIISLTLLTPRENKLGKNLKGLILMGFQSIHDDWARDPVRGALIRAPEVLGECTCRTRCWTTFSNIFSMRFLHPDFFQTNYFCSHSITLYSIKQKYKTNTESSVLYTSTFSSRKGLFCKGQWIMNTHTHALHFLLPREDVFLHLTDSQSRADTHKWHLPLTYN